MAGSRCKKRTVENTWVIHPGGHLPHLFYSNQNLIGLNNQSKPLKLNGYFSLPPCSQQSPCQPPSDPTMPDVSDVFFMVETSRLRPSKRYSYFVLCAPRPWKKNGVFQATAKVQNQLDSKQHQVVAWRESHLFSIFSPSELCFLYCFYYYYGLYFFLQI